MYVYLFVYVCVFICVFVFECVLRIRIYECVQRPRFFDIFFIFACVCVYLYICVGANPALADRQRFVSCYLYWHCLLLLRFRLSSSFLANTTTALTLIYIYKHIFICLIHTYTYTCIFICMFVCMCVCARLYSVGALTMAGDSARPFVVFIIPFIFYFFAPNCFCFCCFFSVILRFLFKFLWQQIKIQLVTRRQGYGAFRSVVVCRICRQRQQFSL